MDQYSTIPQSAPLTVPFTQVGLIIGITGPTGSGKTTLLQLISQMGGMVLDCDAIYHELLATDKNMLRAIEVRFPGTVREGVLDRKALGTIVFADDQALLDLNAITHSAVKTEVLRRLAEKPSLAAIDAIGLFEGGLAELCHVTVAVTAPEPIRVQRLMSRDNVSESYARSRIAAQHPSGWYEARCDHTLVNDTTQAAFSAKCLAFLQELGIMKEKS